MEIGEKKKGFPLPVLRKKFILLQKKTGRKAPLRPVKTTGTADPPELPMGLLRLP